MVLALAGVVVSSVVVVVVVEAGSEAQPASESRPQIAVERSMSFFMGWISGYWSMLPLVVVVVVVFFTVVGALCTTTRVATFWSPLRS